MAVSSPINAQVEQTYKLHFALIEPMHCLTPGLFRSLKKGDRKKQKLEIKHEFSKGKKIEFYGPEPLGVDDLRVLQGLVAIAGYNKNTDYITSETKSDIGISLRKNISVNNQLVDEDLSVAKGSFRELAKEIGYKQTERTKLIQQSVERLCKVTVILESDKKRIMSRLISSYASDCVTGKLYTALNPFMTKVIFGEAPHTRIDMNEVRVLKTPVRFKESSTYSFLTTLKT